MLAIISDLHLTDKTSGEIISESAFRLFRNRLSDMAYDASWRCEKKGSSIFYKPIERMDIILLGDILDMIRSEKWIGKPDSVMPWADNKDDGFYNLTDSIVDAILLKNASSFNILKEIKNQGIKIPQSMQIAPGTTDLPEKLKYVSVGDNYVAVHFHYMVGNHDWFFCIDDNRMNKTRKKVTDALGLDNDPDKPFPFSRDSSREIAEVQNDHRVFAEHGDEYDPINYQKPHRDRSSIGDAVVIKLLNAIPTKIEDCLKPLESRLQTNDLKKFIKNLHEIDNLRPYALAADWINFKCKQANLPMDIVNPAISAAMKELISDFRKCPLVGKDLVLTFGLRLAELFLGCGFSIGDLAVIIRVLKKTKDKPETYRGFALKMADKQDKDFFIMGHTHYAETVPLYNYKINNEKRRKIYINTGTWRTVHLKPIKGDGFISYKTITIAGFYKDDERKGRDFEFWTGYLAL